MSHPSFTNNKNPNRYAKQLAEIKLRKRNEETAARMLDQHQQVILKKRQ
jgi:hypothetical protein